MLWTVTETPKPSVIDDNLAGLDALELTPTRQRTAAAIWQKLWPKLGALAIGLLLWQAVVWTHWKPDYVLPGPGQVFSELWRLTKDGTVFDAVGVTLWRAVQGYLLALVIGVIVGSLVARVKPLRSAVGAFITGLQTMPSIAWFPLAILMFQVSERAIMFVVVLGAAPAIANGLIAGADQIPPTLLRAGRVLGARGLSFYRYIILPGSLPGFVGGLKQGWAFAWRSLMAGELIVVIANKQSIGSLLQTNRNLNDAEGLIAMMIVILIIGILVDTLVFGRLERAVRHRWGLDG
ncbi:MAG: ABC transporter permease [Acidimicrobiia bacterium]|nr:ABC transporter permease [Acidimicrobiia bacterium]